MKEATFSLDFQLLHKILQKTFYNHSNVLQINIISLQLCQIDMIDYYVLVVP